ncbi:MAG TPA: class I SAM-dependent methyltransferase [Desulfovibrio sp.]|nr:class I SAM-dependent methyltransferase [Desulfovibrio sp.]
MHVENRTIQQFSKDISTLGGYAYTGDQARTSMRLFEKRAALAVDELVRLENRTVVDIGCGDGAATVALVTARNAASVVGVEPSEAWKFARDRYADLAPRITFRQGSAYRLPFADDAFDLAFLRGVLHHLDDPRAGLREAFRVARNIFLLEPNGYNPVLKVIEKVSPYHRAHGERSYPPANIRRWLRELGGEIAGESFRNLVPVFCPDRLAGFLDWLSPRWEKLPLLPACTCGLYCTLASRP